MQIQVQAGQFAFYFRYPGPDGKFGPLHPEHDQRRSTENFFGLDTTHDPDSKDDIVTAEMAVPVNREVHLLMHSKDVGHSFFVRELRIQQDFVPGLDLSVHFTPTKIGKYEIVCTQLCGLGHYNMKAYLEVMSQEDFENWLKQQAARSRQVERSGATEPNSEGHHMHDMSDPRSPSSRSANRLHPEVRVQP